MSAGAYRESPAERIREDKDVDRFIPSWRELVLSPANLGWLLFAPGISFFLLAPVYWALTFAAPSVIVFVHRHPWPFVALWVVGSALVATFRSAWLDRQRIRAEVEAVCAAHRAQAEQALLNPPR